jgi:hypothetical protein
MIEDGPCGVHGPWSQNGQEDQDQLEEEEDTPSYGIDWEDMEDDELMQHFHQHNSVPLNNPLNNPFHATTSPKLWMPTHRVCLPVEPSGLKPSIFVIRSRSYHPLTPQVNCF